MPTTCTCAKSPETYQPRINDSANCPTCGNALPIAESYDPATAIQTEVPHRYADIPQFDDDIVSIRIKSRASRTMGICGVAVGALLGGAALVASLLVSYSIFFTPFVDCKADIAVCQAKGPLTGATQAYFVKHEKFPAKLDELVIPDVFGVQYLESKDAIVDPWGNQYHYDIKGLRNNGTKPDIWAVAPNGELIGNWPKVR